MIGLFAASYHLKQKDHESKPCRQVLSIPSQSLEGCERLGIVLERPNLFVG